jgi:hypothetical protein
MEDAMRRFVKVAARTIGWTAVGVFGGIAAFDAVFSVPFWHYTGADD